jgi:short-subunit dehydrogenase
MAKKNGFSQSSAKQAGQSRKTALITGASSGIGEALAHGFAGAGFDVILVARSEATLKALSQALVAQHGHAAHVLPADLAKRDAAAQLLAAVERNGWTVDVLVNCAGVLEQGAFTSIAPAKHQQIIDLNISGLTAMLSAFVPGMVQRGSGRVLNVASVAAFQPIPTLASYAASKAYVLSLSESLAEELRGTGVTVTALCPGITATNMLTQAAGANDKLNQLPRLSGGRCAGRCPAGIFRLHAGRCHLRAGRCQSGGHDCLARHAQMAGAPHRRLAGAQSPVGVITAFILGA